jgi:hypothetical protein
MADGTATRRAGRDSREFSSTMRPGLLVESIFNLPGVIP